MAYTNQGREVMKSFAEKCEDLASIESRAKLDGRNMFMTLTPKK